MDKEHGRFDVRALVRGDGRHVEVKEVLEGKSSEPGWGLEEHLQLMAGRKQTWKQIKKIQSLGKHQAERSS